MLSQNTINIVKSTAPVLNEQGEKLTRHFYQRMFSLNPEVKPFFNPAHQAGGAQQKALAGAICAYAANIDNLEVLGAAVELIAQKHASLLVKPEHYPIVGENLLASIQEILGEAATPDIVQAWAEAYGFLTDILVAREKEIYQTNATKTGGWVGFKKFVVQRKAVESDVVTSFYLCPEEGGNLPSYLPGQYVTVRVPSEDGSTTMRNYSLSDVPGKEYLRITVKRETGLGANPDGYVSSLLHDKITEGDILEIAPPCGDFFFDSSEKHSRPIVLLAAGIGVTPILSILQTVLESAKERKVIFVHACLNPQVQAFKSLIDSLDQKHTNLLVRYRYSELDASEIPETENVSTGFVDAPFIESLLPSKDADFYFCGPKPFMVNIYNDLLQWGIPASQVNFEFFGPREELESA